MGMQYMGEPGIYSMMMNIVPEEARGSASASMAFVLGAAQLIAAACAGWTFTNLGYPRALGIIAIIALTAGLLFKTVAHAEAQPLIACADEGRANEGQGPSRTGISVALHRLRPVVLAELVLVISQASGDLHLKRAKIALRRSHVDAPGQILERLGVGAFGPDMQFVIAGRHIMQFQRAASRAHA